MNIINIQSIFIFYSAISILCGLLLIGLFWGRRDLSASIWITSCFLSAIASTVTVFRTEIPLLISYSLMVSIETFALLLLSQSLWSLFPEKKVSSGIVYSFGFTVCFLILQEFLRYLGNGKITVQMSLVTTFVWLSIDLFGSYSAVTVGQRFKNRIIFNLISIIFFCGGLLFLFRLLNILHGKNYHVFDQEFYNFISYFAITVFTTIRNFIYINLRMHLGFSEHNRLNNMNISLNNLVNEREQMIAAILKSNKSSSTEALSVSIAHELNQPLGASLLNIQFLKMLHESGELKPELFEKIIGQLEKDTKRSSEVIESLRTIFSNEGSSREVISVQEVVNNALAISKLELVSKDIQIKIELADNAVILFNRGQFLQILLNLINNAIHALYSSNSGQKLINLYGYLEKKQYILEVTDTGPGVPVEKQSELFELLVSSKPNGLGVGLWLCAYIMGQTGGRITYQDAPGGGAKFTLSFPVSSEDLVK